MFQQRKRDCNAFVFNFPLFKLTKQTRKRASGNGYRYPDRILRKIDPGMANVWRLNKLSRSTT